MALSGAIVREKTKRLYAHFKEPDGSCGGECTDGGFQASEGWFNQFKVRQSLHSIKIVGEAASADTAAGERYPEEFANLVADGGYKPEKVFKLHCFGREFQTKHSLLKAKSLPLDLRQQSIELHCCYVPMHLEIVSLNH